MLITYYGKKEIKLKGYVFYDAFQASFLERLSNENFGFKHILTYSSVDLEDFKKAPIILIFISQPPESEISHLLKMPWTEIIIRRGVRLSGEARLQFSDIEELRPLLQTVESNFEDCQKKAYSKLKEEDLLVAPKISFWNKLTNFIKAKKKVYHFKGVITFLGGAETAAAFAKHYAKQCHQKVIVVDGDLLMPSMERHFSIRALETSIESHLTGIDNTGINIALDAIGKKAPLESHLDKITHKITNKLDLLIGNYNLYNYEHYDVSLFEKLMHALSDAYDVVVLSVNPIIYDSLTLLGLHLSKANVIVCEDQIESIRYTVGVLDILACKQLIKPTKTHVLHKKTGKGTSVYNETVLKGIFKKQYAGQVTCNLPENKQRKEMIRLMKYLEKRHLEWGS